MIHLIVRNSTDIQHALKLAETSPDPVILISERNGAAFWGVEGFAALFQIGGSDQALLQRSLIDCGDQAASASLAIKSGFGFVSIKTTDAMQRTLQSLADQYPPCRLVSYPENALGPFETRDQMEQAFTDAIRYSI